MHLHTQISQGRPVNANSMIKTPLVVQQIDHIGIRVRDLEASVNFYCEILGCTVHAINTDAGITHLRAGPHLIDLIWLEGRMGRLGGAEPNVAARNMHHFCLTVEPHNSDVLFAFLDSHNIEHSSKAQTNLGANGDGVSVYIQDPDENLVEVKFYRAQPTKQPD